MYALMRPHETGNINRARTQSHKTFVCRLEAYAYDVGERAQFVVGVLVFVFAVHLSLPPTWKGVRSNRVF